MKFDAKLQSCILDSHLHLNEVIKDKPYLTTITLSVCLSSEFPNVSKLVNIVEACRTLETLETTSCDINEVDLLTRIRGFIDEVFGGFTCFSPKKNKHNKFSNCVVFMLSELATKGEVAIKCFTNGNLHITGVKSIERAFEISEMFCAFLELAQGGTGIDDWFQITSISIQMINAHFSVNVGSGGFNLDKLFKLLLNETEHMTLYNNERHAGVIIKVLLDNMRSVSIIVFDSGNVLVCAFCDDKEYLIAFEFVVDFLRKHWDHIWIPVKVSTSKKPLRTNSGFDYGKYLILK